MDSRYNSTYMLFDVDENEFDDNKMRRFVAENNIEDFIALSPSVTGNKRFRCYGTKKNGRQFNYRNGAMSLAKKMKMKPDALSLIPIAKNQKMPDHFFDLLNPNDERFDEQIALAVGRYAQKEMIKAHINTTLTQNKNRQVCSVIKSEGALGAIESGALSVGQLKSAKAYEAEVTKRQEEEINKTKDLPAGHTWSFKCYKTGREHIIESHKDMVNVDSDGTVQSKDHYIMNGGNAKLVNICTEHTKRKHYFFYSPAGYGKTLAFTKFSQYCNATPVNDPNNFSGCREDAQFIVIDEFAPDKRMSMSQLKSLTSGNPKHSFAGNRKSYGASFVPRNDVQVIILSNHHLFYCMGYGKDRKINPIDADALRDRFHIIKMDSEINGAGTEEEDAERFVNPHPDGRAWTVASKVRMSEEEEKEDDLTDGESSLEPGFFEKMFLHIRDLLDAHLNLRKQDVCMSMIRNKRYHGSMYRLTMKTTDSPANDETIDTFIERCAEYPREFKDLFNYDRDYISALSMAVSFYLGDLFKAKRERKRLREEEEEREREKEEKVREKRMRMMSSNLMSSDNIDNNDSSNVCTCCCKHKQPNIQ